MLNVNLNSRIVNPIPAPDLLAAYGSHKAGWNAYVAGESFDRCQNAQERAGWMSALRAESVASLPAACADHLGF